MKEKLAKLIDVKSLVTAYDKRVPHAERMVSGEAGSSQFFTVGDIIYFGVQTATR